MCAIVGSWSPAPTRHDLDALLAAATCRGRDSWGAVTDRDEVHELGVYEPGQVAPLLGGFAIGNTRAEPTTEHVADKRADRDAQPFVAGPLVVSHNGTIANDHDLAPAGYDPDTRSTIDTARWAAAAALDPTVDGVLALLARTVGSYGLAVGHRAEGWVVLATNFKPLFVRHTGEGVWEWTSVNPRRLPLMDRVGAGWQPVDPYSAVVLARGHAPEVIDLRPPIPRSSLVVASGGLDSTVAATYAATQGPTELLHVTYGCRAEAREVEAVAKVGERIGAPVHTLDLTRVFAAIGGSRLTGTWEGVADGVAGAEFAHEWVPARNLILLSVAVGLAEAKGHSHVVLGNNLEEAGAYPDNEQEFIARLDATLPYATSADSHVTLDEPVGGLVKHEVVALGIELGAPLDATWSCYDGGALHCGVCGPCYMRRTAYTMLDRPDPIDYATEAA